MARGLNQLTDSKIRTSKPSEKDFVLSDGGGLQLRVRSSGSKLWNFNYRHPITKKRINMGLGSYPTTTLAEARDKALKARKLVQQGVDPKDCRDNVRAQKKAETEHVFSNVCASWFEIAKDNFSPNHADKTWRAIELHLLPTLGHLATKDITAQLAIKTLEPLQARGSLTELERIIQRLNKIMRYALNAGIISTNPCAYIRDAFKKPTRSNMPSIPPSELPNLLRDVALTALRPKTKLLFEWSLHTMARPAEAARTEWSEIDLDNKVWVIPAEKMKMRKEHRVPLTQQTIAILDAAKSMSPFSKYVFSHSSDPKKSMSTQTINKALARNGYERILVAHGLRSLASTTLNEHGFNPDYIEAALAHSDSNKVRAIYNRTDYLEQRRSLMEWWSNHLERCSQGSLSAVAGSHLRVVGDE